jgi:RimJ/RimL family protein N-acetyltransferase
MSISDAFSAENSPGFRYANSDDNLLILSWRNNPKVRKYSRSREKIKQDTHDIWFNARLTKMDLEPIFIFSFQGRNLGMIRLDRVSKSSSSFEISILVDEVFQKRGFASLMVSQILLLARNNFAATELVANIHLQNLPSIQLFTKLDFHKTSKIDGKFEEYKFYL